VSDFAIFNDEGCVEGGFATEAEAVDALSRRYSADDECLIWEVCPDHDEQPAFACEECLADDDGEVPPGGPS